MYKIYKYTFPNGKIYIGKTKTTIEERAGVNGCRYGTNTLVGNAIRKYGWVNIIKEIIVSDLSKSEANVKERELIQQYNSTNRQIGYNLTTGGDGGAIAGHKVSEETRRKIAEKNRIHRLGKKLSEETRKKISESNKGRVVTDETRMKIRIANTGKHHTEETRLKLSVANKNRSQEYRDKLSANLKASGKERSAKRLATMKERYPNGITQSEESNRKRSEALKGKPKSEETKQKMRKPKSPEAIENMRKAQKEAWARRKAKEELTRMGGSGR